MKKTKNLVLAAMFLALGILLPFFTGQIKEIGDTLLPMHIPTMLCGLLCGPVYGLTVGLLMPVLRGVMFSMPPLYPNAVWMALELATYGFVIGLLYRRKRKPNIGYLYACLGSAMIAGRLVWGAAKAVLLGVAGKTFTIEAFVAGGLLDAWPGIVLQLVLIPAIMALVEHRTHMEA